MKLNPLIYSGAGVLSLLLALSLCLKAVDSGTVGVVYTFGKIKQESLQPGLNLIVPFVTSVRPLDVTTQVLNEKYYSKSKDGQDITISASTAFLNNPQFAASTAATLGLDNKNISDRALRPGLLATVKGVIAKYRMEEIISNQQVISEEIEQSILAKLKTQPNITVSSVDVTGIELDAQVQESIERKQIAIQNKERAATELETAKITSQTNKTLAESITPILVEQQRVNALVEAVKKWDGNSAVFSLAGNTNPVILNAPQKSVIAGK
jgi:regulator of protease activity HflC (stomatin/prohibitin superfamily)